MNETTWEPILSNTTLPELKPQLSESCWHIKVYVLYGVMDLFVILSKENNQEFVSQHQGWVLVPPPIHAGEIYFFRIVYI